MGFIGEGILFQPHLPKHSQDFRLHRVIAACPPREQRPQVDIFHIRQLRESSCLRRRQVCIVRIEKAAEHHVHFMHRALVANPAQAVVSHRVGHLMFFHDVSVFLLGDVNGISQYFCGAFLLAFWAYPAIAGVSACGSAYAQQFSAIVCAFTLPVMRGRRAISGDRLNLSGSRRSATPST